MNFYLGTVPGGRQRFWCCVLLAVITGLSDAEICETSLRFCSTSIVSLCWTRFHSDSAPSGRSILTKFTSSGDDFKFGRIPPERAKPQLFLPDAYFCFLASAARACWSGGSEYLRGRQHISTKDASQEGEGERRCGVWEETLQTRGEDENAWNGT